MNHQILTTLAVAVLFCVTTTKAQWTPDPFCPYPYPDHPTRYPYYGDCSLYWECWQGTKYVVECPAGLEFNAPLEECDDPEIANCDPLASTSANPNPPTVVTGGTSPSDGPSCPTDSDDLTYFPYDGDCTMYWECSDGNKYLYNCPPPLWWHEEISQCDYPGDYCNNATNPTNPTNPTDTPTDGTTGTGGTDSTHDPMCPYPSEDLVYFPYPGDCTKYWECYEGFKYLESCPDGLWWHQEISECDYQGDYCGDSTNPTNPTNPTDAPTDGPTDVTQTTTDSTLPTCPYPSEDLIYYPYPGDCTKYFECFEGYLYEETCPDGLWWHQDISECDYQGDYCSE